MPSEFGTARTRVPQSTEEAAPRGIENEALGLEVADLSPELAQQLNYEGLDGALITAVDPAGIAYAEGLREGMLIRRVGRTQIADASEFETAMSNASLEEGVLLLVRTPQGRQFFVVIKRA